MWEGLGRLSSRSASRPLERQTKQDRPLSAVRHQSAPYSTRIRRRPGIGSSRSGRPYCGCDINIPPLALGLSRSCGLPSDPSLPHGMGLRRRWRGIELGALHVRNGYTRLLRRGLGSGFQSQHSHPSCLRTRSWDRYMAAESAAAFRRHVVPALHRPDQLILGENAHIRDSPRSARRSARAC